MHYIRIISRTSIVIFNQKLNECYGVKVIGEYDAYMTNYRDTCTRDNCVYY